MFWWSRYLKTRWPIWELFLIVCISLSGYWTVYFLKIYTWLSWIRNTNDLFVQHGLSSRFFHVKVNHSDLKCKQLKKSWHMASSAKAKKKWQKSYQIGQLVFRILWSQQRNFIKTQYRDKSIGECALQWAVPLVLVLQYLCNFRLCSERKRITLKVRNPLRFFEEIHDEISRPTHAKIISWEIS